MLGNARNRTARTKESLLLQRVRDQGQDLLILVQQQARREVSQPLVGKARRSKELQTLDLAEMCPLTERKEIEEFCDIVAPATTGGVSKTARPPTPEHTTEHTTEHQPPFPHLALWSLAFSLKLARIDALSFWMTARSSAIVFVARTLRMNCFTVYVQGELVSKCVCLPWVLRS